MGLHCWPGISLGAQQQDKQTQSSTPCGSGSTANCHSRKHALSSWDGCYVRKRHMVLRLYIDGSFALGGRGIAGEPERLVGEFTRAQG